MLPLLIILGILAGIVILYFGLCIALRDPLLDLRFDFGKLKEIPWKFGKGFLWGTATSAYQVEGYCQNTNWYQFESAIDEHGDPRIDAGQKAGATCDQWNLYKDDIKLMKELGLNSYRFSVEWSKIEPRHGHFDDSVLDHYSELVDELLANGIEPMVTLHHFTNPIWFEEKGGFLNTDSPRIFVLFAERVVRKLAPRVKLWCTVNEPAMYAIFGYFTGDFPPAGTDPWQAATVYGNLLRSHTQAYKMIKKIQPESNVGLVVNIALCDPPNRWSLIDVLMARILNENMNEVPFQYLTEGRFNFSIPMLATVKYTVADKQAFDYIGVNYYTGHFKLLRPLSKDRYLQIASSPPEQLTDMGWEIYPEGLYRSLKLVRRYTKKPIYITENGIADEKDTKRAKFIEDHLLVLNKAVADGFDVRAYYYWSLLDNFEWAKGFTKRFGLYHVDYENQKRTLYEGSKKYMEIIKASRAIK